MGPNLFTLAIESAIRGGSVSLFRGSKEIAHFIGDADVSKAEDLLAEIDEMLNVNGLSVQDVGHIAVSAGPGSFTGIRIGIAAALGLKSGLDVPMSSVSALEAIAKASSFDGEASVAVPVGRNAACLQRFLREEGEISAIDDPRSISLGALNSELGTGGILILHGFLYRHLSSPGTATDFGDNIAAAIGKVSLDSPGVITTPLFISKSS